MNATFKKLKDGNWGLRVTGGVPAEGQAVVVSKSDGSRPTKIVAKVLWKGDDGTCLCSIAPDAPKPAQGSAAPARKGRSNWRPCGYPGCNPSYCDECDGRGGGGYGRRDDY